MWFVKKKGEPTYSKEYLQQININLKESFSKIKNDMEAIRAWLAYFKDAKQDQEQRLSSIESRIEELSEVMAYMEESSTKNEEGQEIVLVDDPPEQEREEMPAKVLGDLTETQKSMFYRLGTLLYESSQEWITTKALAQELYPNKRYDVVRSTLSEYISILIESGLVKKRRKGKLTYLSITKKGVNLFETTKKTKLRKMLIKEEK